jgi:hypothetical protein
MDDVNLKVYFADVPAGMRVEAKKSGDWFRTAELDHGRVMQRPNPLSSLLCPRG